MTDLTTSFDYSTIEDKDIKGKLINLEGRIKKKHAGLADSIVEIGQELANAQAVLANNKNGTFIHWVEGACGFSKRTAYRYINVFNRFGTYRANLAQYEDSAMYVLAESETPKKAVDESIKLASNGNRITHTVAKELIAKHAAKTDQPKTVPTPPSQSPPAPTVAIQIATAADEAEPEEPKELTTEEKCEADNKDIESFCRILTKCFDDNIPDTPWIDSQGRVNSARSSLKAACNTLRQSKSVLCPKCDDGQTKKGECSYCKGYGYLPKLMADAIGGDK